MKLMVNQYQVESTGLIKGYVVDNATREPISGAIVRVLGTSTTAKTRSDGGFEIAAYPGINNIRVSKDGYVEIYRNGMVVSEELMDYGTFYLQEGVGTVDFDYYSDTEDGDTMPDLTFSDFDSSHWAYNYVQYMVSLDIISGYPDGTFRPDGSKMYLPEGDAVREHVALAIEYGVMQGSNNRFRPQDPLTRAEASTLFARFLMDIKDSYMEDDMIKVTN